eukprot:COSAG01_NODE_39984_length_469_cov_1.105405_1_plen_62_part_10
MQAADGLQFAAAPTFAGSRDGYVFATRELGTGYYPDSAPPKGVCTKGAALSAALSPSLSPSL